MCLQIYNLYFNVIFFPFGIAKISWLYAFYFKNAHFRGFCQRTFFEKKVDLFRRVY